MSLHLWKGRGRNLSRARLDCTQNSEEPFHVWRMIYFTTRNKHPSPAFPELSRPQFLCGQLGELGLYRRQSS